MSNNFRVIVTVPSKVAGTASCIGRAMDIDVGGGDSFVTDGENLVARTWASESFARMFEYLIANPKGLYMAVVSDYQARWAELEPPSLEEVEEFCNVATLQIEQDI